MAFEPERLWPRDCLAVAERLAQLAAKAAPAFQAELARQRIDAELGDALLSVYLPLAAWIATRRTVGTTLVIGVNGAQGSGKSTLCECVQLLLREAFDCRVAGFSIDDIYRTRCEREQLARDVHPLLRTRGVPGTHDVALGLATLAALKSAGFGEAVALPSFNKARDDRRPFSAWPSETGPFDVVIFEGWCVGVAPEAPEQLAAPINRLEAEEDADGRWRRYVNEQIAGPYAELFAQLDALIMLKVPGMASVFEWRALQEAKLADSVAGELDANRHLMGPEELQRFIMHYERITRRALEELPLRADLVLELDAEHRFVRIGCRSALQ